MTADSSQEHRARKRVQIDLDCALSIEGRRVPCKIRNGSAGGLRLTPEARRGLAAGVPVAVEFEAFGAFDAVVVWANGGDVGLRFQKEPDEMAQVIESMALYGLG